MRALRTNEVQLQKQTKTRCRLNETPEQWMQRNAWRRQRASRRQSSGRNDVLSRLLMPIKACEIHGTFVRLTLLFLGQIFSSDNKQGQICPKTQDLSTYQGKSTC